MAGPKRRAGVCTSVEDVSSRAGHLPLLYTAGDVVRLSRGGGVSRCFSERDVRYALSIFEFQHEGFTHPFGTF